MLKLYLCLISAVLVAALTLELRQQRLELNHQALLLHNQIEAQQSKLWSQQLQIAIYTAPNAIQKTVGNQGLHLVPQAPLPNKTPNWLTDTSEARPPTD